MLNDTERSHALRLCRTCKRKYKIPEVLQFAMLSSPDPIRAICGTYFKPDFKNRRPCDSCQMRVGLNMADSVCSMCESAEGLD